MPKYENRITIARAAQLSGLPFNEILKLVKARKIFSTSEKIDNKIIFFVSPAAVPLLRRLNREREEKKLRMRKINQKIGGGGRVFAD